MALIIIIISINDPQTVSELFSIVSLFLVDRKLLVINVCDGLVQIRLLAIILVQFLKFLNIFRKFWIELRFLLNCTAPLVIVLDRGRPNRRLNCG